MWISTGNPRPATTYLMKHWQSQNSRSGRFWPGHAKRCPSGLHQLLGLHRQSQGRTKATLPLACYFCGIITVSSSQACACRHLLNSSQQADSAAPAAKTARSPLLLASCWRPHTNTNTINRVPPPGAHNIPVLTPERRPQVRCGSTPCR